MADSENKSALKKGLNADNLFLVFAAAAVVLLYFALHLKFMREDADDAWTLSFFYNIFVRHISPESTFGSGLANPHVFGMAQAFIYSTVFGIFGWTKDCAHWISTFFIAASASLWYFALRKLNFSMKSSLLFALLVLWCEPFFREANIARPESLTFFFISLSFVFFLYGNPFFSGLSAMAAFETHPMGLFSILFIAAYILSKLKRNDFQGKRFYTAGLFGCGIAAGVIYYLALHFNYLGAIGDSIHGAVTGQHHSVLYDYFFIYNPRHHFIELVFFLACFAVFLIRKKWRENSFALYMVIFALIANFINPRENYHYTLYFYIPFLMAAFACLEDTKWRRAAPALLFFMVLTYYASVYYHNGSFDFNAKIKDLKASIPSDGRPILGSSDEWFAFMDRDFYPSTYTCRINSNAAEIYNIEDNQYKYNDTGEAFAAYKAFLEKNYKKSRVTSFNVNNERFDIYLLKKPG